MWIIFKSQRGKNTKQTKKNIYMYIYMTQKYIIQYISWALGIIKKNIFFLWLLKAKDKNREVKQLSVHLHSLLFVPSSLLFFYSCCSLFIYRSSGCLVIFACRAVIDECTKPFHLNKRSLCTTNPPTFIGRRGRWMWGFRQSLPFPVIPTLRPSSRYENKCGSVTDNIKILACSCCWPR